MIERDGHDWVVICDRCFDRGRLDRRMLGHQFRILLEIIMACGWYVWRRDGEWTHVCPRCAEMEISRAPQEFL